MSLEFALSAITGKVAIDAVYYLARLIRHRADFRGDMPRMLVDGLKNEPSPEAEKLALHLGRSIEQESGKSLDALDDRAVKELIGRLEQVVRDKFSEGKPIDTVRGDALLEELRRTSKL